jgi:hypothetical protein
VEWRLDDDPGGTRFTVTEHRLADDTLVWGPTLATPPAARPVAWGPRLSALASAAMLCPA